MDLNAICSILGFDQETYSVPTSGTECECIDEGSTLTCADSCQSCNEDGSVCLEMYDFGYDLPPSGLDNLHRCNMRYIKGRDEEISYNSDLLTRECWISIDGESCDSCSFPRCNNGRNGLRIDCSNIEEDALFDACNPSLDGGGILQWLGNSEFYEDGCNPCF